MIETCLLLEHQRKKTPRQDLDPDSQIPKCPNFPSCSWNRGERKDRTRAAQGTCKREREGDGEKVSEERKKKEENTHSLD